MNADQRLLDGWRDGDRDVDAGTNPLARRLAMRLVALDRSTGLVRLGFAPDASLRDDANLLTRGSVAAMLDFACGYVAIARLVPTHTVASSTLRIEWIDTSDATTLEATGTIEARNATTIFTRATLVDARGATIALASSTLRILPTRSPHD